MVITTWTAKTTEGCHSTPYIFHKTGQADLTTKNSNLLSIIFARNYTTYIFPLNTVSPSLSWLARIQGSKFWSQDPLDISICAPQMILFRLNLLEQSCEIHLAAWYLAEWNSCYGWIGSSGSSALLSPAESLAHMNKTLYRIRQFVTMFFVVFFCLMCLMAAQCTLSRQS